MNLSEQLDDARLGSMAAQKYFFDLLADPMMAVCCRYVKNRADAEELLLDGFYKFFSHLAEFRYQGEAALYAWIKTIYIMLVTRQAQGNTRRGLRYDRLCFFLNRFSELDSYVANGTNH